MIGTLEMASDVRTKDHHWSSRVILVDEVAQATEPMTVIPLQVAGFWAHVVILWGSHAAGSNSALGHSQF